MTMQVLQNKQQISNSRDALISRDLSCVPDELEQRIKMFRKRFRLGHPLILGDYIKSWDLLRTIEFLEARIDKVDPVLDIGAYASEVIVSLHKAGFRDLTGVDLNPRLVDMPFQDKIKYVTSDFMSTPFADGSFKAITSISVIEHGYDPARLLKEMSRLLQPGGYFIASFDYWQDKIDTKGTRFFDMSWLIFSEDDVCALLTEAKKHGLAPAGAMEFGVDTKAIEHGGFEYTFGWLVLQKQA